VAGTIKDIENIANPKTNDIKVETNIQNNQLSNQVLTLEEAKKQALDLGVPLSALISS